MSDQLNSVNTGHADLCASFVNTRQSIIDVCIFSATKSDNLLRFDDNPGATIDTNRVTITSGGARVMINLTNQERRADYTECWFYE